MSALDKCYNVFDLRDAAKRRLPKAMFEFVDRSTEDEIALRNNRAAFERIRLRHRALVDVSGRSTKTTLFGKEISAPMAIAPTGAAGLCWYKDAHARPPITDRILSSSESGNLSAHNASP